MASPSPEVKSTLENGKKLAVKHRIGKPILLIFVNLSTILLRILSEEKHFYFELDVDLLKFTYSVNFNILRDSFAL